MFGLDFRSLSKRHVMESESVVLTGERRLDNRTASPQWNFRDTLYENSGVCPYRHSQLCGRTLWSVTFRHREKKIAWRFFVYSQAVPSIRQCLHVSLEHHSIRFRPPTAALSSNKGINFLFNLFHNWTRADLIMNVIFLLKRRNRCARKTLMINGLSVLL